MAMKSNYALILNRLVQMQRAPYYATAREELALAEQTIVELETKNNAIEAKLKQPAVPLTDDVVQKIISRLEPLLDAKNQSWAEAERMLHALTAHAN